VIQFKNVSKEYKRGRETVCALTEVSFQVPKGNMALLCGASGSGKTTLINLCAGLASPSNGEIHVGGNPVHAMRQAERAAMRAQGVAVVFQLFHLSPYLTALENVLLPSLVVSVPDAKERALQLIEQLGVTHRIGHRPGEMSAGERQRCALARALLAQPKVILADEPTGNLDDESATLVLEMLNSCRAAGATILLVSHHAAESVKPDMVFRLQKGRLAGMQAKNGAPL